MRNLLFAALLGCLIASALAQRDLFEYRDSAGKCWMCRSGEPCSPCSSVAISPNEAPEDADPMCPAPDCSTPDGRRWLWPLPDPRQFYQCAAQGAVWAPVIMDCQCGTFFDYINQRCESPWDWNPFCANLMIPIPPPLPCEVETTLPTTMPTVPTVPTINPTEVPTTVVPTTVPQTTVPPSDPCGCIPWFPCWCNPCRNMPCGNCGGCMG